MAPLDHETRLLLIRFACAMAWTDLELHPTERTAVYDLFSRLELPEKDRARVSEWLKTPPLVDDVDPQEIPKVAATLFLEECERIVEADGVLREEEIDAMQLLRQILLPAATS